MAIEVVAGILVRQGRILMQQRPITKDYALAWEIPGGKVEGNESHHDALRRELKEELCIEVPLEDSSGLVRKTPIAYHAVWCGYLSGIPAKDLRSIFLLMYRVFEFKGDPKPQEGQGWGWFSRTEYRALHPSMTPCNSRAVEEVEQAVWG